MLSSHLTIHSLASVPLLMRSMKKAGALSAAVLGSVVTAKLYHNHDKERRHKMTELAKPYLPTLKVDLLGEVASTTDKEKKTCVIIGGGVAGIASAYALCEKGHNVILLEKFPETGMQCSAAPAGGMQRSNPTVDSAMWLAAFQSIVGIAPFQYFRMNWWETLTDLHFLRWFAGFTHNSAIVSDETHKYYQKQLLSFTNWAISDIVEIMKKEDIAGETGFVQTGSLNVYYDAASFDAAAKKTETISSGDGGEVTVVVSRDEVLELEPCLAHLAEEGRGENDQLVGGVLQSSAASGSCLGYTTGMMRVLQKKHQKRFRVESNVSVVGFETEYGTITEVHTNRGTLEVPVGVEVVVAAGSWTPLLLRKLSLYCPVYPMKGYNLIVDLLPAGLQEADFPSRMIVDKFLFSSTLCKQLRVACFGEFDGWNTEVTPQLAKELVQQAGRMFPPLKQALEAAPETEEPGQAVAPVLPNGMEIRTGLRPFVSDGRLLVGRIPEYHNLSVNVGPGFNGWKVATGAARVLEAAITGDSSDIPLTPPSDGEGLSNANAAAAPPLLYFLPDILSPEHRVKHSPWFCHLVNLLTADIE